MDPGTYSIAPRSYNDLGIGDYNLLVVVPGSPIVPATPEPEVPPSTADIRVITMGEGAVEGTIAEAGEFEPWLLEVTEETTVDIYMWSETGALDTYLWLYEGGSDVVTDASAASTGDNDDNNGAVQTAATLGVLDGPVGGNYNSAIMGVRLDPGTYSIVPRSYRDLGIGDYDLLVVASSQ